MAPLAVFKDLILDVHDRERVAAFWASRLGLSIELKDDGDAVLRGPRPQDTLWLNVVPEPKTVKNRVHLDLHGDGVADGAGWAVLRDPEDNELCVFADPAAPTALVVDSGDPVAAAAWWAEVLGAQPSEAPDGSLRWLRSVERLPFDCWKFVPVPEPKTVKNRMHWDVDCDDIDGLVARGARVLRRPGSEIHWHVMADPYGNEFCAFATD